MLNSSPFAKLIDSCIKLKSLPVARCLHAQIIKSQFNTEIFINNRLIHAYSKCGSFSNARNVFDQMPQRNTFTYNAMIGSFAASGYLDDARKLFDEINDPDQCSWNLMVSSFAQRGYFDESIEYFGKMRREGVSFSEYSCGSVISACAGLRDLEMGIKIHALLAKTPLVGYLYMESALVDMYAKCGRVECARKVFDEMGERNVVSWNSLITCYEQNGPASEALDVFVHMIDCGFEPDEMTLASIVSACATLCSIKGGRQIHGRIVKFDSFRDDVVLCNALVDMYAKCGRITEARYIFDRMPLRNMVSETSIITGYARVASVKVARAMFGKMLEKNVVSWNALIAGYTQNGEYEEALALFLLLKKESVWPTHYTFGNLLNACANLADLKLGRQAHAHVLKHGLRFQTGPEPDVFVGNALIDMYVKCGSVEDGNHVFRHMMERDWVSWNALIVGYAQNGRPVEALQLFREMLASGEKPDHVTMIGVLCACSHAGLVEEGRQYFDSMTKVYGVQPLKDHYSCMVDLLGRAGCLREASNLIESMPMAPDGVIWGSLLSACKVHGDIELGKHVAEKLLAIDPTNSGPYVLLSNMYAELGKWKDVTRVRKLMRQHGVIKEPGCSWIEIQSQMHVFMVKDGSHPQKNEIYASLKTLTKLMKLVGYIPAFGALDVEGEQCNADFTSFHEDQISGVVSVAA